MGAGRYCERPFFLVADGAAVFAIDDDLVGPEPVGQAAFLTLNDYLRHGAKLPWKPDLAKP
jgi:hypothetical protein